MVNKDGAVAIVMAVVADKYYFEAAPGLVFFDNLAFTQQQILTSFCARGGLAGGCTYVQLPVGADLLPVTEDLDQVLQDNPVVKKPRAESSAPLGQAASLPATGLLSPSATLASTAIVGVSFCLCSWLLAWQAHGMWKGAMGPLLLSACCACCLLCALL